MSCSHLHRLTKKDYDGTRKTEKDILEMYEFGLEEKALMGTKVKYITFDIEDGFDTFVKSHICPVLLVVLLCVVQELFL